VDLRVPVEDFGPEPIQVDGAEENYDEFYPQGDDDYEDPITSEDCWTVISSFFDEKGLVRQQLDSFDEFIQNTMQELIDESSELVLDQNAQYTGLAEENEAVRAISP
jgi:DNA-directed RNA polymerase II subunit RPB2